MALTINPQPNLSLWPACLLDTPSFLYLHHVQGVYHSPHGTVEVLSWERNSPNVAEMNGRGHVGARVEIYRPDTGYEVFPGAAITAAADGPPNYTRLRMAYAGQGWETEELRYWPVDQLARLASTFARYVLKQQPAPAPAPTGGFGSLQPTQC